MNATAFTAHPNPYIKHVQTRGPRKGSAATACSRCVPLADDLNASAGSGQLVQIEAAQPLGGA